jgi:integrase
MSIIVVTRESFIKRYNIESQAVVKTSLTIYNQYLFSYYLDKQGIVQWDAASPEYIKNFKKFDYKETEANLLSELRKDENKNAKYKILQEIAQYLLTNHVTGKKLDVATAKNIYFHFIKDWWLYNDIELDLNRIKREIKWPKKVKERIRGIDKNMIMELISKCDSTRKGIYYVAAYTGMRIGEVMALDWGWIDFSESPLKISIPGRFTKTKQDRITFCALEAEKWLRQHRKNSGLVFLNPKTGKPYSKTGIFGYFARRRRLLGYDQKKENGRCHFKQHSLRGYAENKLSRGAGGSEFAHTVLGHGEYLISYNQSGKTDDDAKNDYISALPFIALSDSERLKEENAQLKTQIKQVDLLTREVELLKAFLAENRDI